MSTREQQEANRQGNIPQPGNNASDIETEIPSCTIEDIDRALFNLFDKDLPLTYSYKKESKRIPVVFAAGERFALIARKKPLRDKTGVLILPVISIMRSALSQDNEMGFASNTVAPHIIKKKLSRKDPRYQQLLNKAGLKNSDDLVTKEAFLNDNAAEPLSGAKAGRIATRRDETIVRNNVKAGNLLSPDLGNNIYEVIEMPPPAFVMATYDITIWAQYVTQMNDIVMAIMTNTQNYAKRTFRLETKKGYSFIAYVEPEFSPGNNFDDFTDDERIIKTSFSIKVPGYLLGETYPGASNRLRSILSQPQISFSMDMINGQLLDEVEVGVQSGNVSDHVLDDIRHIDAPLPGAAIAGQSAITLNDSRTLVRNTKDTTAMIGGTSTSNKERIVKTIIDPFTGQIIKKINVVKTRTNRNGETVYREVF